MMGDWYYRNARGKAVSELAPQPGGTCFVFFCGTGIDFPRLARTMGSGTIVGLDGSAAMLERAGRRSQELAAPGLQFRFNQANFGTDKGLAEVTRLIRDQQPACLFYSLGLTCLSNWEAFFDATYEAAAAGARFAILDVHSPRPGIGKAVIDWIGAADTARPVWRVLEAKAFSFRKVAFRPFRLVDVEVFAASGTKPPGGLVP
jgi:ubiquinone/menaquinone biosynthesis C-methylase UbiE